MADVETKTVGYISIDRETAKAVLINIDGDVVWLPYSQISLDEGRKEVTLPLWLYKEKFSNDPI